MLLGISMWSREKSSNCHVLSIDAVAWKVFSLLKKAIVYFQRLNFYRLFVNAVDLLLQGFLQSLFRLQLVFSFEFCVRHLT